MDDSQRLHREEDGVMTKESDLPPEVRRVISAAQYVVSPERTEPGDGFTELREALEDAGYDWLPPIQAVQGDAGPAAVAHQLITPPPEAES